MQRFYSSTPLSIDQVITDSDIVHQITRVMRSQKGDDIILFDGDGSETIYTIIDISKKSVSLRGKDRRFPHTEEGRSIHLYQALPNKGEKIEYILQKGVEVGIEQFTFFRSEYSQKILLTDAKKKRYITIAQEALEQCGGLRMPSIEFYDTLGNDVYLSSSNRKNLNIVLDTSESSRTLAEIPHEKVISLWVGPEGGWSLNERKNMRDNGFLFARFGERVLRTETAGIVVSFALIHAEKLRGFI